jgi:hypothetical protein
MGSPVHWLIPVVALLYLGVVINLLRRRKLLETHAVLWILTLGLMAVSPLMIPLLDRIAHAIGIHYSPALYLLIAILFLMANTLRNTLDLSRLTDQNRRLAQEIGLLRHELGKRQRPAGGASRD